MTYAVADVGRGVLDSLRENPQWRSLVNHSGALRAIIHEGATRRLSSYADEGEGFKTLLSSLAHLNGQLRFRSGDGLVTIDGQSQPHKEIERFVAFRLGVQVSVTCSLDSHTCEPPL